MNWKEFKESVESQGVTDDMKMWYIDLDCGIKLDVDITDLYSGVIIENDYNQ